MPTEGVELELADEVEADLAQGLTTGESVVEAVVESVAMLVAQGLMTTDG